MGSPYYYPLTDWHNSRRMKTSGFREKLLIVSGKGGVGKSALASALALRSADARPTIVLTLDAADRPHPFFEQPFTYEPVELAPNLWGANLDGMSAIREYVRRKVPFSGFYTAFLGSRMFRDFAQAAPGFQELMCLGKIYDLVTESRFEKIVFDAPASGHLKTLLDVPAATLAAVLVGPLNHNARKIQDMLLNPEITRLLIAALPEEMAIREARELLAYCEERRMQAGPVLVNQHVQERFRGGELAMLQQLADSARAGGGLDWGIRAALAEAELASVQQAALTELAGVPMRLVPRLLAHDAMTLVEQLAQNLSAEAVNER
jgi:anion-transporting  ArsA/GET3 family ATPase